MKNIICLILLWLAIFNLSAQNSPGFIKSVTDPLNGRLYSNIKSDSLNTLFYEVVFDRDLLYEAPEKNAEVKGYLDKFSLVEFLAKDEDANYFKIRMQNESGSLIEGWSRRKSLSKEKYYGRSLILKPDTLRQQQLANIAEMEVNPQWILEDEVVLYSDSALTAPIKKLSTGNMVFVHDLTKDIARVFYKMGNSNYQQGYLKNRFLSPFALIKGDGAIENIFNDFDAGVLENDLIKAGFVNYLILESSDNGRDEYVEDKLCKEQRGDTISYKQGFSNNQKKINKFFTVKGRKDKHNLAFYRFLPNEKVKMGLDSIDCKVVELVYKPKTAFVTINGVDDGFIENQVSRLMIFHLDKFKTDVVFHRQDDFYNWKFKWNGQEKKYLSKHYKHLTRNKRLVRMNLDKK